MVALMVATRLVLIAINVLGGIAVLGSYAAGFLQSPDLMGEAWGGVPEAWRGLYSAAMLPAALGYFPMTLFLVFRADLKQRLLLGVASGSWLTLLYAVTLGLSALWLPLTLRMIAHPDPGLWLAIHALLLGVGAASCGLVACTLALRPRPAGVGWRLAVAGSLFFTFQTGVLDALVWPAFFPYP